MIRLYRMLENVWFGWPQKLRFLLTGGFNTVFSYGLFVLMVAAIGIPYKIAIAAGYIISTNVSIFTMRYYVFRSKGSLKRNTPRLGRLSYHHADQLCGHVCDG